MIRSPSPNSQRGATLVIGLIMLVIITLMVISAFTLSSTNLKSVGNMQVRNEAIAAANAAIETTLGSLPVVTGEHSVYIGGDTDTHKYAVDIVVTDCVRASIAATGALSSLSLPVTMSSTNDWYVVSDIQATVDDPVSGAKVVVHQGVTSLLAQSDKDTKCGP